MACALLFRPPVEIALQRYSWVGTLIAAVLGAYLCARIVNTVAASAIAPKPSLLQQSVGASPQATQMPPRAELDVERLAKTFDLPLPKPASETAAEAKPAKPAWDKTPVRSSLHGNLVSTALANPPRYSLCQLTNSDINETLVHAIGDKFMNARIYEIEQHAVLQQQRRRASEPGLLADRAAGPARRAERRPAALREPVRAGQDDGERRAQRPLAARHPGAHRAVLQE